MRDVGLQIRGGRIRCSRVASRPASRPVLRLALALACLIGLSACAPAEPAVRFDSVTVRPLVAETPQQHAEGLQGHSRSDVARGMLFVWLEPGVRTFVIKGVEFPLDLVYLDDRGTVVDVGRLSPDGPVESTGAHPATYVLEIEAGWARANGVEIGDESEVFLGK